MRNSWILVTLSCQESTKLCDPSYCLFQCGFLYLFQRFLTKLRTRIPDHKSVSYPTFDAGFLSIWISSSNRPCDNRGYAPAAFRDRNCRRPNLFATLIHLETTSRLILKDAAITFIATPCRRNRTATVRYVSNTS
jgi:hypothetical protein